jgi:A/G-specific adenine glycosylase
VAPSFADKLLAWFDNHGRKDLPWQKDKTPYRVWVSEIMLQQTQVTTVIPYFERFVERFPTIDTLANASQDEVLHHWTGLGYYARARNLHAATQQVMADYNGEIPLEPETLESLPGIGRSTAAAIVSICSGKRATILDGNVKRVLARIFTIDGWPGNTRTLKALWEKAEILTPTKRAADYTQAIMDLGAMVCRRSSPVCDKCPFCTECQAKLSDAIHLYPGKKPKKALPVRATTMLVIEADGNILLEKRPPQGLWGGLWSFPETTDKTPEEFIQDLSLELTTQEPLESFRHTFTHFHLDISPVRATVKGTMDGISDRERFYWFNPTNPRELGLTNPVTRVLNTLQSSGTIK